MQDVQLNLCIELSRRDPHLPHPLGLGAAFSDVPNLNFSSIWLNVFSLKVYLALPKSDSGAQKPVFYSLFFL